MIRVFALQGDGRPNSGNQYLCTSVSSGYVLLSSAASLSAPAISDLIVELASLLLIFPVAEQLLKASVHLSRDFVL
jgi:hypothetical protein